MCSVENGLEQGDALSALLVSLSLEYAIRKDQERQVRLNSFWIMLMM
jgi:hypothetical protein